MSDIVDVQEGKIDVVNKKTEKLKTEINDLKQKNSNHLSTVESLTESEKKTMQDKISANKDKISTLENKILEQEKERQEYEEKIEKLKSTEKGGT